MAQMYLFAVMIGVFVFGAIGGTSTGNVTHIRRPLEPIELTFNRTVNYKSAKDFMTSKGVSEASQQKFFTDTGLKPGHTMPEGKDGIYVFQIDAAVSDTGNATEVTAAASPEANLTPSLGKLQDEVPKRNASDSPTPLAKDGNSTSAGDIPHSKALFYPGVLVVYSIVYLTV